MPLPDARLAPVLAAFAVSACAGAPASAPAPSAQEVETFMRSYTEVWNTHDHERIARDFYRTGPSVEEQSASLARTFEQLRAQGYDKSAIHEIKGCLTGPDTAWAGMKYSRLTAAGDPLPPKDRASAYDLRLFPDGWRITRLTGYDAAQPLACPPAG